MKTKKLSPVGQVVREIVMALVDFPEDVEITEVIGEQTTVLEVSVRKSDHGKAVGRGGRLAGAIREILACHTGLRKRRYLLEILEEERVNFGPRLPLSIHPSHAEDPILNTVALLVQILKGIVDDSSSVRVNSVDGLQVAVFEVEVAPEDNRRVIGKGGRVVSALREWIDRSSRTCPATPMSCRGVP